MSSVHEHYKAHLAPIYLWMVGGLEQALSAGAGDVAGFVGRGRTAVDLGAGFGMHTIPLARSGYDVLAIDTSSHLLAELVRHTKDLKVRAIEDDLLNFDAHLTTQADVVLCMGDTLTHLQDADQVATLMRKVARSLLPGGHFVATFRDYTTLPAGDARFIPVRSDPDRIHTCFLEEAQQHVRVHDIVQERTANTWNTRVSSYLKLRLSREAVIEAVTAAGLRCQLDMGARGMLKLQASG